MLCGARSEVAATGAYGLVAVCKRCALDVLPEMTASVMDPERN
jgi:hypothetical protein